MLPDIPCPQGAVKGLQSRVHILHQHLPARHALVFLLVGMQRIVELLNVGHVLGNKLLPGVVFLILVGIV